VSENCHLKERKKEKKPPSSVFFSPTHKIICPFIIFFFFFLFCQFLWNLTIPKKNSKFFKTPNFNKIILE
jgi:hypothetical protein